MLVRASHAASALISRLLFYAALFLVVVVVQMALTTALKGQGWNGGLSLFVSGAVVLALVLAGLQVGEWIRSWRASGREKARVRQKLTDGACCVLWKPQEHDLGSEMPGTSWALRARYPELARRLGVEGYAIAEFEVGADGAPRTSIASMLGRRTFSSTPHVKRCCMRVLSPRAISMCVSARATGCRLCSESPALPKVRDSGRRARTLRPILHAAGQAVEKLRTRPAQAGINLLIFLNLTRA